MAVVVDITELKKHALKINDLANYYSDKQSSFSYGSFNIYSCTKFANYINSVGQLFKCVSNNLTNAKNYIENYANDISKLDKKYSKAEDISLYKVSDTKMFQVNIYKDNGSQNTTSIQSKESLLKTEENKSKKYRDESKISGLKKK